MTRRLSEHVASPAPSDAALARQWKGVEGGVVRVQRRRRIARIAALAAPLLVAAALLFVFFGRGRTSTIAASPPRDGTDAGAVVELPEGSRLRVAAGANARILSSSREDVRVALDDGRVEVEASHDPARRSFVVASGDFEVRVVGTVFWVVRQRSTIEVGVREGRVQIALRGAPVGFVSAGETRTFDPGDTPPPPSAPSDPPAPSTPATAPISTIADRPAASAPKSAPSGPRQGAPSNPSDTLFESAQKARVEGRIAEAARLFDEVRRKHRADPHAALAAFELGRLRLDALGDPAGAVEAFSDALVLGPGSALAEDATARRVEALGKLGDHDRCATARDAYLRQYPSGVYARAMVRFCK